MAFATSYLHVQAISTSRTCRRVSRENYHACKRPRLMKALGVLFWAIVVVAHTYYNESLHITPLPRNRVLTSFEFEISSGILDFTRLDVGNEHYAYFSRALGPVIESNGARELHLRFGQGWWDAEKWGELPYNGSKSGGTGVEIWAVIEAPSLEQAKKQWYSLTKTLSGFFCALFNFIDDTITTTPKNIIGDGNTVLIDPKNSLYLLKAALPSEPICTENLTPFLKLLPTRGKAGVSSLLDGHKLFDSLWHAMLIDVNTVCTDAGCHLDMQETISAVIDVNRSIRKQKEGGVPKPTPGDDLRCDTTKKHDVWTCFPAGEHKEIEYSLNTIFGRTIKGSAFVGDNTGSLVVLNVHPELWKVEFVEGQMPVARYSKQWTVERHLTSTEAYNVLLQCSDNSMVSPIVEPPVRVARSLTGYSQDKGGIRAAFTNQLNTTTRFVYLETLPWFMKLHMHTLTFTGSASNPESWILDQFYRPLIDRERPLRLEFVIELPPHATLTLSFKFHKNLLLIHEYPPDANHGFAIDPAVVTVISPSDNLPTYEFRTTSMLLTLPVPDFSMPYNVIILTCTVMSLAFGSIFNLLIKKTVTEDEYQEMAAQSGLGKLKQKLRAIKSSIKGR